MCCCLMLVHIGIFYAIYKILSQSTLLTFQEPYFLVYPFTFVKLLNYLVTRRVVFCSGFSTSQAEANQFSCETCHRRYKRKEHLMRHIRYECNKQPQFKCPFCEHRSKQQSNVKVHIATKHRDQFFGFENKTQSKNDLYRRD